MNNITNRRWLANDVHDDIDYVGGNDGDNLNNYYCY